MQTPKTNEWRYRREPRPFHQDEVGYHALAAGIVKQAVEDYRNADEKLKQADKIECRFARAAYVNHYENIKDEIVKFFKSSWYGTLCDIDPNKILRKLGAI